MKLALALLLTCSAAYGNSVTLSWNPSSTAPITGYHIYRAPCYGQVTSQGTCNGSVGTYKRHGSTAAITYIDNANPGQKLVYYVTAYCSGQANCAGQSTPSNIVVLQVPGTPSLIKRIASRIFR